MLRLATACAAIGWLAGCPLNKSGSTTMTMGASTASPSAAASDPAPSGGPVKLAVPDFTGKTLEEAAAIAKAAGFVHPPEATRPVFCDDAPSVPGKINCQDPDPGKVIDRYGLIAVAVFRPNVISNAIVRHQLKTLHGLTPDQAKLELKKLGHDGEVHIGTVTDHGGGKTFIKECGVNKVCYTSDEAGIGMHDQIILFINPVLTIASPPP
jgi:hypothetical protein